MSLIYTTVHYLDVNQAIAWFEIKDDKIYPAAGHPDGPGNAPWVEIRGNKIYSTKDYPYSNSGEFRKFCVVRPGKVANSSRLESYQGNA